jgi:hypothetical protein
MADLESPQRDDELLSAYLDDELTSEERARVEERLAADPAARHLLEELLAVSRTMKELPAESLGIDLRESVLRRAERAMLVSGEVTSTRGRTNEARWNIPMGRSKRAWFWAATALAAGILLMVFERAPDRNRDLPNLVAQGEHDGKREQVALQRNEPLPPLEMRAIEPARDEVAAVLESPPTETAAPPAVPGGRGGLGGDGARRNLQVALKATGSDSTADDLLVVHVNMKPEAMQNRSFDALLSKNQIEVEPPAVDKLKRSSEPQDVDVVVVEAAPSQIYSCLADLKKDDANYVGIAVDDRLANSQRARAAQQPEAELTQYNRGTVPNQQLPQLSPENDNYYYVDTDRGPVEIDRRLDRQSDVPAQRSADAEVGFSMQGRAAHVEPLANSPGHNMPDQAPSSVAAGGEVKDLSALAAKPAAAPPREKELLSDQVPQNVARRAMQKMVAKADTLQVLFVLTCPTDSSQSAAGVPTAVQSEEGKRD